MPTKTRHTLTGKTRRGHFVLVWGAFGPGDILSRGILSGRHFVQGAFCPFPVNDIKNCIPDSTVKLFAADTNLFIYGKSLSEAYAKANASIKCLCDWFNTNKLSLNVDKSCYSVFGGTETGTEGFSLKVDNSHLKLVRHTKYLGIIIDSDLSWKDHIEYLYKKLLKFTSFFYKLRYSVPPCVMKMLYFAFVYPQLLYGITVYGNTCKSHLDKLMVLNNKLLRIAQNCTVRTRSTDLYRQYHTLPLPTLHQYEILLFVHKCLYMHPLLPNVFCNYFQLNNSVHTHVTRSSNKIHLHFVDSSFGSKCVKYKGCTLWNSLPNWLTSISSFSVFKRKLKDYVIQN